MHPPAGSVLPRRHLLVFKNEFQHNVFEQNEFKQKGLSQDAQLPARKFTEAANRQSDSPSHMLSGCVEN
jgi:hypothetical protein